MSGDEVGKAAKSVYGGGQGGTVCQTNHSFTQETRVSVPCETNSQRVFLINLS